MNKLMKYRYLPRRKNITLSTVTSTIVEEFVPALHYKYVFKNFRQTSLYRTYNPSVVPAYLQGRPRSTILHCLHCKATSNKFSYNDIHDVDSQLGMLKSKAKAKRTEWILVPLQACHHAPVGIGRAIIYRASTSLVCFKTKKTGPGTNYQMLT